MRKLSIARQKRVAVENWYIEYKAYRFKKYDPVLDQLARIFFGRTVRQVAKATGISESTLYKWKRKKTRSPRFATVAAAVLSYGGVSIEFDPRSNRPLVKKLAPPVRVVDQESA
jgi:hypothetical protein